jgi:hypothetical protein
MIKLTAFLIVLYLLGHEYYKAGILFSIVWIFIILSQIKAQKV